MNVIELSNKQLVIPTPTGARVYTCPKGVWWCKSKEVFSYTKLIDGKWATCTVSKTIPYHIAFQEAVNMRDENISNLSKRRQLKAMLHPETLPPLSERGYLIIDPLTRERIHLKNLQVALRERAKLIAKWMNETSWSGV